MKTEASAQNTCVIRIDHPNRIVSFQKAEGFEPQSFASPMSGLHTLLKSARADIACSKKPHSKQMILKGAE